jgi:hypothetical protein
MLSNSGEYTGRAIVNAAAMNIIHIWPDLSMTLLEARRDGSSDCFGRRFPRASSKPCPAHPRRPFIFSGRTKIEAVGILFSVRKSRRRFFPRHGLVLPTAFRRPWLTRPLQNG